MFFAFSEKRYRRLLMFYILISGSLYFIFGSIPGQRSESSLEIIHDPDSQTIIVNHGGGMVLFRQTPGREVDDFSRQVMPYLLKREREFPQYFVFFESKDVVERRLEGIPIEYLSGSFLPATQVSEVAPSVYRYESSQKLRPADTCGRLSVGADWAAVQSNGGQIIVFVKPGDLSCIADEILLDSGAIFIIPVQSELSLKAVQGRGLRGRLIFLPERPLEGRREKAAADSVEDDMDLMDAEFVEVGEFFRLPLNR
jgi:hypothetical protein